MRHLATLEVDGGVRIQWDKGGTTPGEVQMWDFRRTVIGMSFPESSEGNRGTGYGIAIVIGERVLYPNDPGKSARPRPIERFYAVLDEADDSISTKLFDHIVRLKDRYLCSTVYCPRMPVSLVEALKRHEGIAYYMEKNPGILRQMFPSFVSTKHTAGIYPMEGSVEAVNRDIDALLNSPVHDPDTGEIIRFMDYSFAPMPRLFFPGELNNVKARTGVQSATNEVTKALWVALNGLENSRGYFHRRQDQQFVSNSPTGY